MSVDRCFLVRVEAVFFSSTVDPFHWRTAHANLVFSYGLVPLYQDKLPQWRYTVVNEERGKKKLD